MEGNQPVLYVHAQSQLKSRAYQDPYLAFSDPGKKGGSCGGCRSVVDESYFLWFEAAPDEQGFQLIVEVESCLRRGNVAENDLSAPVRSRFVIDLCDVFRTPCHL